MVRRDSRLTSLAVSGCLLVLLAACGPFGSADSGPTPAPGTSGAPSTPTTAPMPATQTACPTAGKARAAVLVPLVAGSHQNIVYVVYQFASTGGLSGEIKRYDAATGKYAIVVNALKSRITWAQISADGQWILFQTLVSGELA
jgi:hypothetical protein